MDPAELLERPEWRRTGHSNFPVAAVVRGAHWVLRLNGFPDHPLWTLFVDGHRRFDVDDAPASWGEPADPRQPALPVNEAARALAPVRTFVAYGSESGSPCEGPYCCG